MSQVFSIGVNAYEANVARRVGSNLYAFKILCELERLTRSNLQVQWDVYLPSTPLFDMPKERPGFRYVICPPKKLWTLWRLPLELYRRGRNHAVFFSLGHYSPRFSPVPQVICILDLAFLKFPQFFLKKDLYQLTQWTKRSVSQASHIFTISESAKQDILEIYGKSSTEVTIAYPGVEIGVENSEGHVEQVLAKFHLQERKYIVALGTIQPRKNITSAIKAFEQVNPKYDNAYRLVLVGKSGWLTEAFEQVRQSSPQKDNIIVTGFVEEDEKWSLLRRAVASILVGYYEGFGIPAVESMSVGVTPIVANTASLPEVVGKFGISTDPYSIESIAHGMHQAIEQQPDTQERAAMIEWATQFSWEKSAKTILEVLHDRFQQTSSHV